MSFIGIDMGTSFVKGAILDAAQQRIEHVRRVAFPGPVTGLPRSQVEIDPRLVTAAVDWLIDELAPHAAPCQGVLLCGQMGGVILVDGAGQPRTNYISWRDQRVLEPAAADGTTWLDMVRQRLTTAQLAELGNELRPGSCTGLLFWLAARQLAVLADAIPLSLPAFVATHLTRAISVEDATLAIGGLDVRSGAWHHEAFRCLGIDAFDWPNIASARAAVGLARVGGVDVPCYPAVGDHQCALLGVGLDEQELSVNVSTGSQVSRLTREAHPGAYQLRRYFDGWLLQTITHLPAGRSLDALVALFTELPCAGGMSCRDPWPYILEQAAAAPDAGLAVNLSFFSGTLGDEGSLTGVRLENLTVGHVFRAALRNMASNYAQCAGRLDPQRSWQRLVFSGGLANRLELLRKFVLAELPGPHRLCAEAEDTLTGLLALALLHDGRVESALAASAALRAGNSRPALESAVEHLS